VVQLIFWIQIARWTRGGLVITAVSGISPGSTRLRKPTTPS
jgi:hypothetical protein